MEIRKLLSGIDTISLRPKKKARGKEKKRKPERERERERGSGGCIERDKLLRIFNKYYSLYDLCCKVIEILSIVIFNEVKTNTKFEA